VARLWPRKRNEPNKPDAPASEPAENVHLDGDDHAWWAQVDVAEVWKPSDRKAKGKGQGKAKEPVEEERDILAEHFGDDWRTNFLYAGPTEEQLAQERRREQQAIDDQDPYKVLQVSEDATWDEIVAAHRFQARVHHPDRLFGQSDDEKVEGEERIRIINQAYQELRVRRGM
jgi:DnaJ domain